MPEECFSIVTLSSLARQGACPRVQHKYQTRLKSFISSTTGTLSFKRDSLTTLWSILRDTDQPRGCTSSQCQYYTTYFCLKLTFRHSNLVRLTLEKFFQWKKRTFGKFSAEPNEGSRRHDTKHNDIKHNETQHNDIPHNETQHNDSQHNDTQHNDIPHNNTRHSELSIIALSIMTVIIMTLCITTFSIMALSITTVSTLTLSITIKNATLSIMTLRLMRSIVMLSVVYAHCHIMYLYTFSE